MAVVVLPDTPEPAPPEAPAEPVAPAEPLAPAEPEPEPAEPLEPLEPAPAEPLEPAPADDVTPEILFCIYVLIADVPCKRLGKLDTKY